jgi:hypothetical protein
LSGSLFIVISEKVVDQAYLIIIQS